METLLSTESSFFSKSSIHSTSGLPWVEKYRPINIKDVIGNEECVSRLIFISEEGNMPNLIITGPPGTGKTTSIHCVARSLLGDAYNRAVLELNASDERGINVVREQIKSFSKQKVTLPIGRHKIIILDEADNMTPAAQQALRRIMEEHTATTRFALACNQSSKIIEPIQSRCAILRFHKLSEAQIYKCLVGISLKENVKYNDEGMTAILFTSEGDMRQAINCLQATHVGLGFVSGDNVFKVCDQPHPEVARCILKLCEEGNISEADKIMTLSLWKLGYNTLDIVSTLFKVLKYMEIPEYIKLEWIKQVANTHKRALEGLVTQLQISGLLASLADICIKAKDKEITEEFKKVTKIYQVLIDAKKREEYDRYGEIDDDEDCCDENKEEDELDSCIWTFDELKLLFSKVSGNFGESKIKEIHSNLEYQSNMNKYSEFSEDIVEEEIKKALDIGGVSEINWSKKTKLCLVDSIVKLAPTLTNLYMSDCKLKLIPENTIGELSNLTKLDLSANKFERFPDCICLSTLKNLNIQHNLIKSFPKKESLAKLLNLEELNLFGNRIKKIPDYFVTCFTKLRKLDLECNQLNDFPYSKSQFKGGENLILLLDPNVRQPNEITSPNNDDKNGGNSNRFAAILEKYSKVQEFDDDLELGSKKRNKNASDDTRIKKSGKKSKKRKAF